MAFRHSNALPPETSPAQSAGSLFDGGEGRANVRFGPHSGLDSDIAACPTSAITGSAPLFDHLVSQREHGRGDSDTERLRGFQIDY